MRGKGVSKAWWNFLLLYKDPFLPCKIIVKQEVEICCWGPGPFLLQSWQPKSNQNPTGRKNLSVGQKVQTLWVLPSCYFPDLLGRQWAHKGCKDWCCPLAGAEQGRRGACNSCSQDKWYYLACSRSRGCLAWESSFLLSHANSDLRIFQINTNWISAFHGFSFASHQRLKLLPTKAPMYFHRTTPPDFLLFYSARWTPNPCI